MRNLYLGLLPVLCLACLGPSEEEPTQKTHGAVTSGDDATHDDATDDDCSGPSCGKCVSNGDCGSDQQCSTVLGDCQSWCACPECDVCAGSCVPIVDPTCGECISDGDCKEGNICSNQLGECLGSCSCPACDVCAGHCVAPDASQ